MRSDYEFYFNDFKKNINKLGAVLVFEDELSAKFSLFDGWSLLFDCEKYYCPAFTISIKSKVHGEYAIWILMEVFELLRGLKYGKPTIENQIKFIEEEKQIIFYEIEFYKEKYNEVNSAV